MIVENQEAISIQMIRRRSPLKDWINVRTDRSYCDQPKMGKKCVTKTDYAAYKVTFSSTTIVFSVLMGLNKCFSVYRIYSTP